MIGIAMYTTVLTLYRQGKSQRKISKLLDIDRKSVRKIIKKYESTGIEEPGPIIRKSVYYCPEFESGKLHKISYITRRRSTG